MNQKNLNFFRIFYCQVHSKRQVLCEHGYSWGPKDWFSIACCRTSKSLKLAYLWDTQKLWFIISTSLQNFIFKPPCGVQCVHISKKQFEASYSRFDRWDCKILFFNCTFSSLQKCHLRHFYRTKKFYVSTFSPISAHEKAFNQTSDECTQLRNFLRNGCVRW